MRNRVKRIKRRVIEKIREARMFLLDPRKEPSNGYAYDNSSYNHSNDKIVVYSCITGDYDTPMPVVQSKNIDYILFVDKSFNKNDQLNGWKVKKLPQKIELNNTLTNRYIKLHPNELFNNSNYRYAIYIDGNIGVKGDLHLLLSAISDKTGIGMHRHHARNCIYIEGKACKIAKKGNAHKIKEQLSHYQQLNFPKKFGLYECNVIAFDLKNKNEKLIMDEWWDELVRSGSMRDQLSLPFVIWKMGYDFSDIGSLGNNVYKNELFAIKEHKK